MKLTNEQLMIKVYGEEWNKKQREKGRIITAEEIVNEVIGEAKRK